MKIGIIGAGNIGGTLALKLVKLGHQVAIANPRGPETLRGLAAETEATPGRIALPVAGDCQESWRQQPGTRCYAKEHTAPQWQVALAAAEHSRVGD